MSEKSHASFGSVNVFTKEDILETDMRTIRKKLKQGLRDSLVVIGLSNSLSINSYESYTENGNIILNLLLNLDLSKDPSKDDTVNLVWARSVKSPDVPIGYDYEICEDGSFKMSAVIPYTRIKNASRYRVATIFSMARMVDKYIKL